MAFYNDSFININLGPFRIPIPFGSIDVDKNPDGSLNFGANSDINILGYGANSGLNFQTKDGHFVSNCKFLLNLLHLFITVIYLLYLSITFIYYNYF